MKKFTTLLFLAIGVTSCSVESLDSTENLLTADANFSAQSAVTISGPEGVDTFCVGETYLFNVSVNTTSNFQVQQKIAGVWTQVHLANQGQSGSTSFNVVLEEGTNFFRHTNQGSGSNWAEYSQTFEGVVCKPCENSLEAVLVCGEVNTLTVTFTAEEAGPIVIQGGLNAKASIQEVSYLGVTETTKPGAPGNASVTRWEGNLEACQEVTITINFTGGNEVGSWTAVRLLNNQEVILGETEDNLGCSN